jgi:cysteine synthase
VSGIDGIGNTPVVRLDRLTGDEDADVWVKLEAANPTGSYKDRTALAMIEAAERDGRLKPGQSLAFVCAVKGYPLHVVSSDAFASEKLRTMQAFGAEVELIPSPEGITPQLIPAMVSRARQIAAETGAFWTDQFNNPDMLDGYRQLGAELLQQLPGPPAITAFCSYVGTAGCFLGTTGTLRTKLPTLHRVVVEPAESAVLSGGVAGTHQIEGGGIGSWPPLLQREDFDEVIAVSDADAFAMARRAARAEGIFSGPSTGANLVAALQHADHRGAGGRVVTVQVDSGIKYLNGPLYR